MRSRNGIFLAIMLVALILVLVATGVGPILVAIVVDIAQAIGSFFLSFIPK